MRARIEDPADRHPYRSRERGGLGAGWRSRRLALYLLLVLVAVSLVLVVVGAGAGGDATPPSHASPPPQAHEDAAGVSDELAPGRHLYALPLPALRGLPPDVNPGTLIELWVSWEPPLTDEPAVQRLLEGVRVHRLAPAVDPNAPDVALLDVAAEDVPDLIYGDRYGNLNATLAPPSS
jgi:hypothetical protein